MSGESQSSRCGRQARLQPPKQAATKLSSSSVYCSLRKILRKHGSTSGAGCGEILIAPYIGRVLPTALTLIAARTIHLNFDETALGALNVYLGHDEPGWQLCP